MVDDCPETQSADTSAVAVAAVPLSARAARASRRSAEREKYECTAIVFCKDVGLVTYFNGGAVHIACICGS
jgi:hypothetical protein